MSKPAEVLTECAELLARKSSDYQNPNSNVRHAMHYRRGIDSIHDIIQQKVYRAQSLLESRGDPKFESIEDTYKDIINYAAFAVSYIRHGIDGQDPKRDVFNRVTESSAFATEARLSGSTKTGRGSKT